jgi:hypothetical protein
MKGNDLIDTDEKDISIERFPSRFDLIEQVMPKIKKTKILLKKYEKIISENPKPHQEYEMKIETYFNTIDKIKKDFQLEKKLNAHLGKYIFDFVQMNSCISEEQIQICRKEYLEFLQKELKKLLDVVIVPDIKNIYNSLLLIPKSISSVDADADADAGADTDADAHADADADPDPDSRCQDDLMQKYIIASYIIELFDRFKQMSTTNNKDKSIYLVAECPINPEEIVTIFKNLCYNVSYDKNNNNIKICFDCSCSCTCSCSCSCSCSCCCCCND